MSIPALEFDSVEHRYGDVVALRGIDLTVAAGEVVCLLGPSGCGKTTALRLAAGLEPPAAGRVLIDGRLVADAGAQLAPEARGIGLVFQDYALFPHLSVAENVAFGLDRQPRAERRRLAIEVLRRVHMDDHADSYPHMLSGGQQQRVALARALAPSPHVLLLDEPYSGLDARLKDHIREELLAVLKASGCATVMVTHDAEEAMFMADRIAVMREGRIVQTGTPEEVYCRPRTPFVAAFLGEVNRLSGVVADGLVRTVLGNFQAMGFDPDRPVDVLVRPESLTLEPASAGSGDDDGPAMQVVRARLIGRSSLVSFRPAAGVDSPGTDATGKDAPGEDCGKLFHALHPGVFLPPEGARMQVRFDHTAAHVFVSE
jgi:iron(III) transport system ATP-binding protein